MTDAPIRWRIEGTNRVRADLRRYAKEFPEVLDGEIGRFTRAKAQELRQKAYPPPPPNSTYVRTGRLGASWGARKVRAAVWHLQNLVHYAGWVVDEHRQAWMHQGRWWLFQDVCRPAPDLTKQLTEALRRVIRD